MEATRKDQGRLVITVSTSKGDRIYIGDDIILQFNSRINSNQVGVSITAPRSLKITRDLARERDDVDASRNKVQGEGSEET